MAGCRSSSLLALAAMMCMALPASGQDWKKKPFTEWSLSEVAKILSDSPWAQTQVEYANLFYGVPTSTYSVTIRLRSALPIRQALLRQKQILMNYRRFRAADKRRFDEETRSFVECSDCRDYYLVTLVSHLPSNTEPPLNQKRDVWFDIVDALKRFKTEDLKSKVYLANDRGERRDIVLFIPPKGGGREAMFIFARRNDQGKALITPDNKKFYFRIEEDVFKGQPVPLKPFMFQVDRLIQNGEVVF
jgi:hypothetical protein